MPIAMPTISCSASGVSITRCAPKRCCRPRVARNTPPFRPTSWPSTTTESSSCIARAIARLMASTMVSSAMAPALGDGLRALRVERRRQGRIQVIEHELGRRLRRVQVGLHRELNLFAALLDQLLFFGLAPGVAGKQMIAQPQQRLVRPRLLELFGAAVARCVVRSGMVREPIADRLEHGGAAAAARGGQ